jgi:hypothetical protein
VLHNWCSVADTCAALCVAAAWLCPADSAKLRATALRGWAFLYTSLNTQFTSRQLETLMAAFAELLHDAEVEVGGLVVLRRPCDSKSRANAAGVCARSNALLKSALPSPTAAKVCFAGRSRLQRERHAASAANIYCL